jgi:hypothetical protein
MSENLVNRSPESVVDHVSHLNVIRRYQGSPVEMLAGADDLTADRGTFLFIRAGSGHDEPAAVVEFNRNGRWAIPISMLFVPGEDHVRNETTAFIIAGRGIAERQMMVVSFELMRGSGSRQTQGSNYDGDGSTKPTDAPACKCDRFGNCPDCRE